NDAVDLWLRTSPDGSSFDSGANNYAYSTMNQNPGGIVGQNSAGDTKIIVNAADQLGNSTQENMSFDMILFNAAQTAAFTMIGWTCNLQSSVPGLNNGSGQGRRLAAAAVKGVQLQMSASTIATGKISILGRRKVT